MANRRSVVSVVCLVLVGCTQTPGALQLKLVCDKTIFSAHESITFDAVLVATEGSVCLARLYSFEVELRSESGESKVMIGDNRPYLCGTHALMTMPLIPIMLLDVGDARNQFEVLREGNFLKQTVSINRAPSTRGELVVSTDSMTNDYTGVSWAPGEYSLRVRLLNDIYYRPAPVFWKPYNQPVEGEIRIEVTDPRG